MSYDPVNPVLLESRSDEHGNLGLCIPAPLLTRLKEQMQASVEEKIIIKNAFYTFIYFDFRIRASLFDMCVFRAQLW